MPLMANLPYIKNIPGFAFALIAEDEKLIRGYFSTSRNSSLHRCLSFAWLLVLMLLASTLTLKLVLPIPAASNLMLPLSPVNVPAVEKPKFLMVNFTVEPTSTGVKFWAYPLLMSKIKNNKVVMRFMCCYLMRFKIIAWRHCQMVIVLLAINRRI